MSRKKRSVMARVLIWRMRNISDKQFVHFLSVITGLAVGIAAVLIKNSVHFIQHVLHNSIASDYHRFWYFLFPIVGILIVVLFVKFIIRRPVGHGIPGLLFAISKKRGRINKHNMYSSIITSALTVGFGGSVGLEGPSVATGAAIGSNIGASLRLKYKDVVLLIGCACAGAVSSIFQAPIAAIVFALEVIMLNLSMSSIVSLLLASSSAVLASYLFTGKEVVYSVTVMDGWGLSDVPSFIVFGVICGLAGVYFKRVYVRIEQYFDGIESPYKRLLVGGGGLGILLFFFPSLYGEGYLEINNALGGDFSYLYEGSVFQDYADNFYVLLFLFVFVILLKTVAASFTFGSGGVGGVFAPALFMGANMGLMYAVVYGNFGIEVSKSNFALLGMGGMIASVLHAPLTGMFLIADITEGYELFVPLMITSTIAYGTVKYFEKSSVYTYELVRKKQLITHHKDKAVLSMMNLKRLIENDFTVVKPDAMLDDIVKSVEIARRNIFPVVNQEGVLVGMFKLDDVRHMMFKPELYDCVSVDEVMYMPEYYISLTENMEDVVRKIHKSGRYNFPVIEDGKYVGFVSRAKVFSAYRKLSEYFSEE